MKLNGIPIGRWQKQKLGEIIATQQNQINQLNYLLNIAVKSININKKRRSQLRDQVRAFLADQPVEELGEK